MSKMKKVRVVITVLVALLATAASAVEVTSTVRFDYTGELSMWYMPAFDFGWPINPSAAIIISDGSAELYGFMGGNLPAGFSLSAGPAIKVNTDDRKGYIDETKVCAIVCGRWSRVSFDSLNMWGMPRTNGDLDNYWSRWQFKYTFSKSVGFFSGFQIEGSIYTDDSKSFTTGPNAGLDFGGGCLEFYYGVDPSDSSNRKVRVRWTRCF